MAAAVGTRYAEHSVSCFVRGHHIYKNIWSPVLGESLTTEMEEDNQHDHFAVAVCHHIHGVVGHLPRNISRLCVSFLDRGGTIIVTVTGKRVRSELLQGGLDVPCTLSFSAKSKRLVERLSKKLGLKSKMQ